MKEVKKKKKRKKPDFSAWHILVCEMPIDCLALIMKWKFKNVVVVVRRRTTYITCPPRRCGVLHKTREGGLSRKIPPAWSPERCAVVFVVKKHFESKTAY